MTDPTSTPAIEVVNYVDSPNYVVNLQNFLNQTLSKIMPKNEERYRYLDQRAMNIWITAMTHETVDANVNYEELEYRGDAVLKYVFPKYLMIRYPNLKKDELTRLNIAYMSKIEQANFARRLGLDKFARVVSQGEIITNIAGDLFESFMGALDTVGDSLAFGRGAIDCYNMITYLYNKYDIDMRKKEGDFKTQVQQLFPVGGGIPKEEHAFANGKAVFSITLTPDQVDYLRNNGIDVTKLPKVVGSGSGRTKISAEYKAYENAYENLSAVGATTAWIKKQRNLLQFSDPEIIKYVKDSTKRLKNEGYKGMVFFTSGKTKTPVGQVINLLGIKSDDSKKILGTVYVPFRKIDNLDGLEPEDAFAALRAEELLADKAGRVKLISNYASGL